MRHSNPHCQRHTGATALLVALLFATPGIAQELDIEIERSGRPNSPVRDPLAAWQRAREALPAGARVRRLAFADHILFVFHSAPGESAIRSLTLAPVADGFVPEDDGERDASMCVADGVDADRVEPGLRRVLASPEWQRHARRMDSLILECMSPTLAWTLMPVPEGGYKEGVAIQTLSLPFEPAAEVETPALERD